MFLSREGYLLRIILNNKSFYDGKSNRALQKFRLNHLPSLTSKLSWGIVIWN